MPEEQYNNVSPHNRCSDGKRLRLSETDGTSLCSSQPPKSRKWQDDRNPRPRAAVTGKADKALNQIKSVHQEQFQSHNNDTMRRRSFQNRGDAVDTTDRHTQRTKEDDTDKEDKEHKPPSEPDFGLSGALAAETNTVNGIVILHNEPPEGRLPPNRWRLYVFKDGKPLGDPLHIHRQSRYLFGRERKVVDIPTDHPSCSKQHAVIQYRLTEKEGKNGMMEAGVRPYLMDLGSTNGTFLNGDRIESERYYELLEEDLLKFGHSSREYVLLKEI